MLRTFSSTGCLGCARYKTEAADVFVHRLFRLRAVWASGWARNSEFSMVQTYAADVFVHRLSGLRAVQNCLASMLKPVCYLHLATACFTTGLFKSCPSAPLLRRCLPSIGACLVLPTRAWVGQEYVLRWVLPRTRKFSELCGPTVLVPSPTSAVSAASSSWLHCLASGVLLCLLVGSPPLPVVGGRLPQLRNGRPEARLRWSEPGSSPPLAALPCFGARFLSLTHSLTHCCETFLGLFCSTASAFCSVAV